MSKPINGISPGEWAKHLRPYGKRAFWKSHRAAPIEESEKGTGKNTQKKRKKFGIETRYIPGTEVRWWHGKTPFEWQPYWHWYHTKKSRDQALAKMNSEISYNKEYRAKDRH